MIEAEIVLLLNNVRKELISVNEGAAIIGHALREARGQITVATPLASKAEEITSSAWMGELERRIAEAKRLSELYYAQQDYESAMKLDIKTRALSEALLLARSSPIDPKLSDGGGLA